MKFTTRVPKLTSAALAFALVALASTASPAATFKIIQTFNCTANSGCGPRGPLTPDPGGNLYGTAFGGGANGQGSVFELLPNQDGSWSQTIIHSFAFTPDGAPPAFGVAFDELGNLYGTTLQEGGPRDLGTVWELTPDGGGWAISLLYDGAGNSSVLPDHAGNVYGPIGPGAYENGAVAELSPGPSGWTYTALYSFCAQPNCSDGSTPSTFVFDAKGNLFGTTLYGGNRPPSCRIDPEGCGVAFELTSNRDGTWTYHLIHTFAAFANDAQLADGALLVDRN
ncbi:MAG: choice-of-anchor tandem repeat GloVer-containing protein, partial [Terriglobales bacterium]